MCILCYKKTKGKERVFYPSLTSQVTVSHLTPDTGLQPRYNILLKVVEEGQLIVYYRAGEVLFNSV